MIFSILVSKYCRKFLHYIDAGSLEEFSELSAYTFDVYKYLNSNADIYK